jgi:hypothetical protein
VKKSTRSVKRILLAHTLTYFNLLNLALALLILFTGEWKNMLFFGVVISNTVIGIAQELKVKQLVDRLSVITASHITAVRDGEKTVINLTDLETAVAEQLEQAHVVMYNKAKQNLTDNIYEAHSLEEAKAIQQEKGGFIKTMWCGELECELKMKEEAGMSSRCMPLEQENLGDVCPICGKPAKHSIYWGVAY